MNDLRVNNIITIKNIKEFNIKGNKNENMYTFIGNEATITEIFYNMYDKKDYYFLDIDENHNIWSRDMLEYIID